MQGSWSVLVTKNGNDCDEARQAEADEPQVNDQKGVHSTITGSHIAQKNRIGMSNSLSCSNIVFALPILRAFNAAKQQRLVQRLGAPMALSTRHQGRLAIRQRRIPESLLSGFGLVGQVLHVIVHGVRATRALPNRASRACRPSLPPLMACVTAVMSSASAMRLHPCWNQ